MQSAFFFEKKSFNNIFVTKKFYLVLNKNKNLLEIMRSQTNPVLKHFHLPPESFNRPSKTESKLNQNSQQIHHGPIKRIDQFPRNPGSDWVGILGPPKPKNHVQTESEAPIQNDIQKHYVVRPWWELKPISTSTTTKKPTSNPPFQTNF